MYPYFTVFGFDIYIFGLTLVVCFFAFLWMLNKLSTRFNYDYSLIVNSILWYFLSIFIFSRLFYIISMWKDAKYIESFFDFFITSNYHFSLFGAIFGFFVIFYLKLRLFKKDIENYLDGVILSFLFVLVIGFIGAFFGGQVSGIITNSWFGIENTVYDGITTSGKLFPLAIVYSSIFFIEFIVFYILSLYIKKRGLIGYIGLGFFSAVILGMEFFSGKRDLFKNEYNLNFSQICAIVFIVIAFYGLFTIILKEKKGSTVILGKQD